MRSRSEPCRHAARCTGVLAALLLAAGVTGGAAPGDPPTDAQVSAAVKQLNADPNLAGTRKVHTLKWAGKPKERTVEDEPAWQQWLDSLFTWVAESGRVLIWAICSVLVGLSAIYLLRIARERRREGSAPSIVAPTHVRDLDIRPESLPDDIGAAGRELWERGAHRAALALLYRGCLSRLAHAHGVPIRDSTTEGECVELAAQHLSSERTAYVSRLVRVWQRAVYRGEDPAIEAMLSLCDGFRGALDPTPLRPAELAA